MRAKKKKRLVVLLLCYAAAIVVWVLVCTLRLVMDNARAGSGALSPMLLDLEEDAAYASGIIPYGRPGEYVSQDPDPWFLFEWPQGTRIAQVAFESEAIGRAGGAVCLYYTTAPGEEIDGRKMLWADRAPDGRWIFDLGGRAVYKLRLDPGTSAGVLWRMEPLSLNEPLPAYSYYLPDARGVFLLLFAPPLVWAAAGEISTFLSPVFARRRFESRWRRKPQS